MPVLQLTLLNDNTILLNQNHIVAVEDTDSGSLIITTAQYKQEAVIYSVKETAALVLRQLREILK